jgi:hypothetical protein
MKTNDILVEINEKLNYLKIMMQILICANYS